MSTLYDEDLFEGSKMTFGEHLEELRRALLRAVIAVVVGFLVGLMIGGWVVRQIQNPVQQALLTYYTQQTVEEYKRDRQQRGAAVPAELKTLEEKMLAEGLLGEPAFLNPHDILAELKQKYGAAFSAVTLPEPAAEDAPLRENMIRVFLWRPIAASPQGQLQTLNPQEAFMIYIKAALISGLVLASPLVFFYVWDFVGAGLYPHEKRYVHLFMPISIGLFLAGAALAFFVVFQYVLDFLLGFNAWLGLKPELRISEWMSFVLMLPIGFGISFQLPLVMLFLERIGIFDLQVYLDKWRIAVLVITIISMVLTPADPMSMILMATPLVALYFVGIGLCRFLPRNRSPFADPID